MIHTVKSEFRKLLTVRSTYFAAALVFLIIGFMALYIEGFKEVSLRAEAGTLNTAFREIITNAVVLGAFVSSIIAALFMVHEYRHNTITHTLTLSNSRTKVLVAKTLVVVCYAVVFGLLCGLLALGFYRIGLALSGHTLVPQSIDIINITGRALFFCVGYAMLGFLLGVLTRNIAFALAVIFIAPNTIEPLIGLLLKDNAKYLPFSSLQQAMGLQGESMPNSLSPGKAMLVFSIYMIISWIIAWQLFLRRDAN